MLTREELRTYEGVTGFNLWQVEKDYLQHILLLFLYQRIKKKLVFKGGTALQKAFGLNRFSIDLDFTSLNSKMEKVLEGVVKDISNFGFPSTISRIHRKEISETIIVEIKGPLYDGSERTMSNLRLEVSLRRDLILKPMIREIVPVYPDLRPYIVVMMNLEEILAEKVGALMWRAKARDLYDLWFLLRKNVKLNLELVNRKLSYYNLKFDEDSFLESVKGLRDSWELEMKHLVNMLPTFNIVKEDVKNLIKTH